jgi:hypothetical protein
VCRRGPKSSALSHHDLTFGLHPAIMSGVPNRAKRRSQMALPGPDPIRWRVVTTLVGAVFVVSSCGSSGGTTEIAVEFGPAISESQDVDLQLCEDSLVDPSGATRPTQCFVTTTVLPSVPSIAPQPCPPPSVPTPPVTLDGSVGGQLIPAVEVETMDVAPTTVPASIDGPGFDLCRGSSRVHPPRPLACAWAGPLEPGWTPTTEVFEPTKPVTTLPICEAVYTSEGGGCYSVDAATGSIATKPCEPPTPPMLEAGPTSAP